MNSGWLGLGIGGGVLAGLALVFSLGVMEVSSSSAFCGSCHVMREYYASWSESTHRDVACVQCHMPSEVEAQLKKKFEGLSMMAGTLVGSVSAHISAQVDDEACLNCHERRLLVGQEWFNTVLFDHRPHLAELRRGVRLTCSSCHAEMVQGSHLTVTGSSCLVCHFMKQEPSAGEARCSMCHQIDGLVAEREGKRFDHSRAVELDITCDACHAPGATEVGGVPRQRCLTCHNRPERLEKYGDTEFIVETHVNKSKALCPDCHQDIEHVGERHQGPDPVRCGACHEPRRTAQLNLFTGLGLNPEGLPASPMQLAGVRCEACHIESPGMKATPADERACLRCHPLGVERLLGWWLEAVSERQTLARGMFETTTAKLDPATSPDLREAGREIAYVERGRGVHNLLLAMSLLDSAVAHVTTARAEAGLAPLPPPWPQTMAPSECVRCHSGTESRSVLSFGRDFGHGPHVEKNLECERCHSKHQQRREEGAAALLFDQPGCQGCHHERLDLESCASCHEDLHRAQFAKARCDDCHAAEFWTPAPGFDHQAVAYPLTGGHQEVACAKCHLEEGVGGKLTVRYRGIAHQRCEDCHENIHAVQLGPACEDCHVTESWVQVDRDAFDHETTRYALRGGHAETECEACHPAGKPTRLEEFGECLDCHQDEHHGQFAALDDGSACEPCHDVRAFLPTTYSPDHHEGSDFPLRGAHLAVPCDSCHQKVSIAQFAELVRTPVPAYHPDTVEDAVQFVFASTACDACHEDPHAGGTDEFMGARGCEACHREESWSDVVFDHGLDSYSLEGKHSTVACIECHPRLPGEAAQSVQLKGVPTACAACHENPHTAASAGGARTGDCERCHTADGWSTTRFDHGRDARFPLIAAHSEAACESCHPDTRYDRTPADCSQCHFDPHRGELGLDCERCHTPHGWTYNVEALTTHAETLFPLDGAHASLDCGGCHEGDAPFEFSTTPTDCHTCHTAEYQATTQPDHALVGLSTDCATCHDSRSWFGARIDPATDLDHDLLFELRGAHRSADCDDCHADGYRGIPRDCVGCHLDDFNATREPDHRLTGLPSDCALCHTVDAWRPVTWSHSQVYALEGAHRGLECDACHGVGFVGTSGDCQSCHEDDYANAEPDHRAAGFDTDCSTCHDQERWERTTFDHVASWPLTGGHRRLECADCHAKGFGGTPNECYSCHARDYRQVADPNHRAAGFARTCEDCHRTSAWSDARLDHDQVFYLGGAHRALECVACHEEGYTGTPRYCVDCHRGDFDAVRDPDHRAAGYDTDCTACHTDDSWSDARIDHEGAFPLSGAHRGLECGDCHADGYSGTSSECGACHRSDYDKARDPDHRAAGIATDCVLCHTTEGWSGASFEHTPYYALDGAHRLVECNACHAAGYPGTPTDCVGCHRADFDAALDPDHRLAGLPTDCALCHTTDGWHDTIFSHELFFPLTGAHATLECLSCHADGYAGTPTDCVDCHQADYDTALEPDHRAAGFPRDCILCHTTEAWQGATFSHDLFYPLTGAHAPLDCLSCHAGGYENTPRECFDCHRDDYLTAPDPDHEAAEFDLDCTTCHSTSSWEVAVFSQHDSLYFPIYSGTHQYLWGSCRTCHRISGDYSYFSCTTCHNHRRDRMDRLHQRVVGYEYDTAACYACHPTGRVP